MYARTPQYMAAPAAAVDPAAATVDPYTQQMQMPPMPASSGGISTSAWVAIWAAGALGFVALIRGSFRNGGLA